MSDREQYLRGFNQGDNTPPSDFPLDKEIARAEAKRFWLMEDQISRLLRAFPYTNEDEGPSGDFEVIKNVYEVSVEDRSKMFTGVGFGSFHFTEYFGRVSRLFPLSVDTSLGVSTQRELSIHLHMDDLTMDQSKRLLEEVRKAKNMPRLATLLTFMSTYYYFDKTGSYRKVLELPSEIQDDRQAIYESGSRYVISNMTFRDFEYVGIALSTILSKLKAVLPHNEEK